MNKTLTESEQKSIDKRQGCVYKSSGNIFIIKEVHNGIPRAFIDTSRSAISVFSAGSGRRMRKYLRECLCEYRQMVTLTYPEGYPSDGKQVKEHLRRFLQELKREQERHNIITGSAEQHSSFWFLEFQRRGAPHFHIFTTFAPVPRGTNNWVAIKWYNIVNSEDIRHLQAGTRTEFLKSGRHGTIAYASKYAQKQEQKQVPEDYENVGRFWGISGRRDVMSAATYITKEQAKKTDIKQTLNSMFMRLQMLINKGIAEVYVRDVGVLVVFIHSIHEMRRTRGYIGLLSARTMTWERIFDDAEIED